MYRLREIERACRTKVEEKKLPSATKVMRAKVSKMLTQAMELREHEDMELMKKYLELKAEEEGCDVLELAAGLLKMHVGDMGEDIPEDEYAPRRFGMRGDRRDGGRFDGRGRNDRGRDGRGRNDGRRSDGRRFDGPRDGRRDGSRTDGRRDTRRDSGRGRSDREERGGRRNEGLRQDSSIAFARPKRKN